MDNTKNVLFDPDAFLRATRRIMLNISLPQTHIETTTTNPNVNLELDDSLQWLDPRLRQEMAIRIDKGANLVHIPATGVNNAASNSSVPSWLVSDFSLFDINSCPTLAHPAPTRANPSSTLVPATRATAHTLSDKAAPARPGPMLPSSVLPSAPNGPETRRRYRHPYSPADETTIRRMATIGYSFDAIARTLGGRKPSDVMAKWRSMVKQYGHPHKSD